jgi:hypothetical protein
VLRLLALYGLRPVELQHIQAKRRDDGSLALWCGYQKNCGGTLTEPRWIEPCPVKDITGQKQHWNLAGALSAGLLELPLGADGKPRELNGHYVEQFLRRQPEWQELLKRCEETKSKLVRSRHLWDTASPFTAAVIDGHPRRPPQPHSRRRWDNTTHGVIHGSRTPSVGAIVTR